MLVQCIAAPSLADDVGTAGAAGALAVAVSVTSPSVAAAAAAVSLAEFTAASAAAVVGAGIQSSAVTASWCPLQTATRQIPGAETFAAALASETQVAMAAVLGLACDLLTDGSLRPDMSHTCTG